jgi:O-antigen/teichoic acid export membrane protein
MRQYFVILIAANGFALVAGAAVLILWQSLYALVLYRAVRLVFSLLLFGMAVPRLPRVRFDLALFRSAWHYAVGLYGARMLSFFSTFGTDLILAYLFTTAESGLYRFANRLAMSTVDIIAQPLRSFALKSFGRAARMQAPLTPLFAAYFTGTLFLTGGFALTVFFLGEAMTRALFQPEYLLALGAIHALALRALARAGQSMIEPTFAATKDTRVAFHNNLMLAAALLVVTLLAAPYGFVRVAWAQALVQLAFVPLSLWIIARWSPVDVIPCLRHSLRALVLLGCYAAALWLVGAVLQPLEMNAAAKLLFGMMAAVTVGAVLSLVAYLDGILKPQIFAD